MINNMKTILCYGDSLTWGYNPKTRDRYPFHRRWPGALQKSLEGKIRVIEEALNGRTTIWDDPFLPRRNGKTMLGPLLISHTPIDLVIILLGTNDIQPFHKVSAKEAARGCGALIDIVQKSGAGPSNRSPQVLLIAPPPFGTISEMMMPSFEGSEEESKKLGYYYSLIAKKYGCYYLDSSQFIESSKIDGIHLDEPEQEKLGLKVKKMIVTIFKGFK